MAYRMPSRTVLEDALLHGPSMLGFVPLGLEDFSFTEFVAATFNRKKCLTEKVGRVIFNSFLADESDELQKAAVLKCSTLRNIEHIYICIYAYRYNNYSSLKTQILAQLSRLACALHKASTKIRMEASS